MAEERSIAAFVCAVILFVAASLSAIQELC
jgi:hypothetical protein